LGARDLSLFTCVQTETGTHSVSYTMDAGGFSTGLKRLSREADNLVLYNAEAKNAWNCTSTLPWAQLYLYFFYDVTKIRQCAVSWRAGSVGMFV
jgi:hypothetical protein